MSLKYQRIVLTLSTCYSKLSLLTITLAAEGGAVALRANSMDHFADRTSSSIHSRLPELPNAPKLSHPDSPRHLRMLFPFLRPPDGLTNPDSITTANGNIFVVYANSTMPDGTGGFSTIVEYSPSGKILHTFDVTGKADGLK
jgi:hypothetical protein